MKQILLILVVVALAGCGNKEAVEKPESPKDAPEKLITDPIAEKAVREELKKPTGELTKADLEKVWKLDFSAHGLTEVPKGLEQLTQLTHLHLSDNKLTDVKSLEKLTKLKGLNLINNPDLTKAQIAELQKALPNCFIRSNPKK